MGLERARKTATSFLGLILGWPERCERKKMESEEQLRTIVSILATGFISTCEYKDGYYIARTHPLYYPTCEGNEQVLLGELRLIYGLLAGKTHSSACGMDNQSTPDTWPGLWVEHLDITDDMYNWLCDVRGFHSQHLALHPHISACTRAAPFKKIGWFADGVCPGNHAQNLHEALLKKDYGTATAIVGTLFTTHDTRAPVNYKPQLKPFYQYRRARGEVR